MATYLPNVTDVLPDPSIYTPNFSYMDTMLRRKQAMYEQGFAQVNNAYGFINRNVTNPYSLKVRDEFLNQSKNNLKNLSAMDLSQQKNVESARQVFDPFVKNKPVLMDMAYTAYMDQQETIAETYRLKDGGKEFSEDNLNYLRQQRAAFANDTIDSVGSYYSNRRSFNPYYNYNQEVSEAMKNFKPSSTVREYKNGRFEINRIEDKSWYKEELAEYLNGVLSDKAKNQMNIEAVVRLSNNHEALSAAYVQEAQMSIPVIDKNLDKISREISLEKDSEKLQILKSKQQYYTDKKSEINSNLNAIQKGDLTYIKNNSEKLARAIYGAQKVKGFIDAYSHKDFSQEIKFNDAALSIFKEEQANWRTKYTQDRIDQRELGTQENLLTVGIPADEVTASSKSSLAAEVKNAENTLKSKHQELKDHMAIVLGGGRTAKDITDVEFKNYVDNNPGDKKVAEYTKIGLSFKTKQEELKIFDVNADKYAREQMGDAYSELEKYRAQKKNILLTDVPKVEWDAAKKTYVKTINMGGKEMKIDVGKYYHDSSPTGLSQSAVDKQLNQKNADFSASLSLGWDIKRGLEMENQYKTLRDSYFKNPKFKDVASSRTGFQLKTTDSRFKSAVDFLQQNSNIDKTKILSLTYVPTPKGLDIILGYDDGGKESKIDTKAAASLLKSRFRNNDVLVNTELKTITIKASGSQISPILDPYSIVEPIYRDEMMRLEEKKGPPGSTYEQPFVVQDLAGRNMLFRITKSFGNSTESDGYYLYGDGTKTPIYDIRFDNALAPYKTMNSLLQEQPAALDVLLESKK